MNRPHWNLPASDGLDFEAIDQRERGMLDGRMWRDARLVALAHHLERLDVSDALAASDLPAPHDPTRLEIVTCAVLTIAGRPAEDGARYDDRERLSVRCRPRVGAGVARFMRSTLWRDRTRLGLAAEASRTRG